MSSIYNILDQIIDEYVGVEPTKNVQHTIWGLEGSDYVSLDPDLRDAIVEECNQHIHGKLEFNAMSKDAQECISQWEKTLQEMKECDYGTDNREYC